MPTRNTTDFFCALPQAVQVNSETEAELEDDALRPDIFSSFFTDVYGLTLS
jgi:hypothetical protein